MRVNDVAVGTGLLVPAPASPPSGDGKALVRGRHMATWAFWMADLCPGCLRSVGLLGSVIPVTARPFNWCSIGSVIACPFKGAEGSVYSESVLGKSLITLARG
jgi:hypothetical protein